MAIDKESSGLPEVDLRRRTTKVNLAIVVAAVMFYIITSVVLWYFARRSDAETNAPNPPIINQP
jgi:hypothetical protein